MNYFKRLYELIGPDKKKFLIGLLCTILKGFSFIFLFAALHLAFENIHNITSVVITKATALLVCGLLLYFVLQEIQNVYVSAEAYYIFKRYRLNVGAKLKKAPLGFFSKTSIGDIQGALTNNITQLELYTMMLVADMVSGFSLAIILSLAFMYMSKILAIFILVVIVILAILLRAVYTTGFKYLPKANLIEKDMVEDVIDMISGIGVIRTFPGDNYDLKEKMTNKAYADYEEKRKIDILSEDRISRIVKAYEGVIAIASVILVILVTIIYKNGSIDFSDAMTMIVGSYIIFLGLAPLSTSILLFVKIPAHQAYIDKVTTIPELEDGKITDITGKKDIEFENVSFSYKSNDEYQISDVSFKIFEGQNIALVGPSGSGKTTTAYLISRFFDTNKGVIRIAGKDIREYSVDELLLNVSMVFQNVYLFNDTVKNNIKIASPNATDEEIIEVCKKARCHEFISKLKDGYDTIIAEAGNTLSGGEKQRISIARALLKDAPIVILDEATSSIDPENEAKIQEAISELCKNKTVITIAHKLNTVKSADNILVLNEGKLVQSGKHDELILEDGIYKNFIEMREKALGWKLNN